MGALLTVKISYGLQVPAEDEWEPGTYPDDFDDVVPTGLIYEVCGSDDWVYPGVIAVPRLSKTFWDGAPKRITANDLTSPLLTGKEKHLLQLVSVGLNISKEPGWFLTASYF